MLKRNRLSRLIMVLSIVLLIAGVTACSQNASTTPSPSPGPVKGTLVQNDSIITGQIKAIVNMPTGYPWEIDVLVQSSQSVGTLTNPTSDKVGQVVKFRTDESPNALKVGQVITAHAKLTGDVELGTTLYIYDIK